MKKSVIFFLIIALFALVPVKASAHVLIRSELGQATAIVHVNPDDDPVAGEEAIIFFDIKSDDISNSTYDFSATVSSEYLTESVAIEEVGEQGIRMKYIFPTQGSYAVNLEASGQSKKDVFRLQQFVGRGVPKSHSTKRLNDLRAEFGLIMSVVLLAAIMVIVINRRRPILSYTHKSKKDKKWINIKILL